MTFSDLTTHVQRTSQKSMRNHGVDRFIQHHAVSTSWQSVVNLMMGAKEVSANYVIGNGGELIGVVDEEYRAWTSSSAAWDGRAITVEVCNETLAPGYTISAAAQATLSKLMADVSRRYGFPLRREGADSTVIGHRELYSWFGASYPTACPGGLPIDATVQVANDILAGAQTDDGSAALLKRRQNVALPLIAQQSAPGSAQYGLNIVIWDSGLYHWITGAQRDVWLDAGAAFLDCQIPGRFEYLVTEAEQRLAMARGEDAAASESAVANALSKQYGSAKAASELMTAVPSTD